MTTEYLTKVRKMIEAELDAQPTPEVMTEKKVKAGLYLSPDSYYKIRIWLMGQRPRISFSEYAELATREKFEHDTIQAEGSVLRHAYDKGSKDTLDALGKAGTLSWGQVAEFKLKK